MAFILYWSWWDWVTEVESAIRHHPRHCNRFLVGVFSCLRVAAFLSVSVTTVLSTTAKPTLNLRQEWRDEKQGDVQDSQDANALPVCSSYHLTDRVTRKEWVEKGQEWELDQGETKSERGRIPERRRGGRKYYGTLGRKSLIPLGVQSFLLQGPPPPQLLDPQPNFGRSITLFNAPW